ncbi:MAG: SRPBCC family protein [Sulfobacillus sp.]|nr:SRPBCC family protein [Sulfobacillus sp.]
MTTVREILINKRPDDVWRHVANIAEWPRWNGAVLGLKPVDGPGGYAWRVQLPGIGWVLVSIHMDRKTRRLTYRMRGKGAAENGQVEVLLAPDNESRVRYTIHYRGWAAWWPLLRNTAVWRLSRLKEWCETGTVQDPWALDMSYKL